MESPALWGMEILSQGRRSFQQAQRLGSRAKSILQGEFCLTQLSAALFLDVQKPRPVGETKSRALSLTRDNLPLPPFYKSSNFPMAITPPESVTPSEMLTCVRISDSNTCQAVSGYQKADTTRQPLFCQRKKDTKPPKMQNQKKTYLPQKSL